MLQLDPTTLAALEAATTPTARAQAVLSSINGAITVTVYDGSGNVKGSGSMTKLGTLSANVIVLDPTTSFSVSSTGTPDPATWTIEFKNGSNKWMKGTFGLSSSPTAEFKWSLGTWTSGQAGTIANAYATVQKREVLTDVTDTFNVSQATSNSPPVWTSNAPATLSLNRGSSYDFRPHAYEPDGDVNLTYSVTPVYTGITIPNGVLTIGTSAALATRSLTIRVMDSSGLYDDHVCSVTISAPSTATFVIPAVANTSRSFNGASASGWTLANGNPATRGPRAGDIIELAAGTHGPLNFDNVIGTETNPIILRGPQTGNIPATIRRYNPTTGWGWGSGGFLTQVDHCHDLLIDGFNPNIGTPGSKNYGCGIKLMYADGRTPTKKESCSAFMKIAGTTATPPDYTDPVTGITTQWPRTSHSDHLKIRYVEIDGGFDEERDLTANFSASSTALTLNPGIGFGFNDHGVFAYQNPGRWKEKIIIEHCYVHNCRTEAMYLGPNFFAGNLMEVPIKGFIVRYNRIEDSGWDAVNGKCWWEKPTTNVSGSFLDAPLGWNVVHGNIVHRTGRNPGGDIDNSGVSGLGCLWSTVDVFDNIVIDAGGQGIFMWTNMPTTTLGNGFGAYSSFACNVYNNLVVRSGLTSLASDPDNDRPSSGIKFSSGTQTYPGVTQNNTVIGTVYGGNATSNYAGYGITLKTGQVARNNILLNNASDFLLNGGTESNNWIATGQTLGSFFENPAIPANPVYGQTMGEVYDYHLKAAGYVSGKALGCTGTPPVTDLDGGTRRTPASTAAKGAYEY